MNKIVIVSIVCLFILGCQRPPKIEITRDYIYNSSWGKHPTQVSFSKIEVAPSIKSKDPDSIRGFEIYNNRILDPDPRLLPWKYVMYIEVHAPKNKKVYFGKKNKDLNWFVLKDNSYVDIIGILEIDTWYQFYGLHPTQGSNWEHYVYVDKEGEVHLWAVMVGNI